METLEQTAKTVEEAVELALKQLDAEREEVEIEIVSRGKAGILGIGAEPARVRVTRLSQLKSNITVSQEVLDNLLGPMRVSAVAHLVTAHDQETGGPVFDIEGEDSGLLIGRRGETLQAIQFLMNIIVSSRLEERANLTVDVEGYRERRRKALSGMAMRHAKQVEDTGRSITLEPMPASERRMVHMALSEHPKVTTESSGQGPGRRVTIRPRTS